MNNRHLTYKLLLKAELTYGRAHIVTHTVEISETLVFVHTDEDAYIGDKVMVNFSFPGLVAPFVLETQVVARHSGNGPGHRQGWTLGFMFYSAVEQTRLLDLLRRVQRRGQSPGEYRYRVLLVEDNAFTREAFALGAKRFFGAEGDPVAFDIVADRDDAWNRLRGCSYDLAIVDYFLPILNGDRLIAELRRDPDLAEMPIFAISIGGAEARDATLAAGADLFLPKPLILRNLFHTLDSLTRLPGPAEPQRRARAAV